MALFFFLLTKETLATCQLLTVLLFEDRLFYSASPVCSSFSAAACAILQALCLSPQHQQVYRFSFLSRLLSLCPGYAFLSSVLPTILHSVAILAGIIVSFLQLGYNGSPLTRFFHIITRPMSYPDEVRCSSNLQPHVVFLLD